MVANAHPVVSGSSFTVNDDDVEHYCARMDAREDCSDFAAASLLKLLYGAPEKLSDANAARIRASLLDYCYWMDEPGHDQMCLWSENHHVMFAVIELLAGQKFPEDTFTNLGVNGAMRQRRGQIRLWQWLADRFSFGFSEWYSTTYYEVDVAALALCIDYCHDDALRLRCQMVLDIVLLDMALHTFQGNFVGTSGRSYAEAKKNPESGALRTIVNHAFGGAPGGGEWTNMSTLFTTCQRYEVPPVLRKIANNRETVQFHASTGLDVAEVSRELRGASQDRLAAFYWLMEAFVAPQSVQTTAVGLKRWKMTHNRFLSPMRPFALLATLPGAGALSILPHLVRMLNPVAQGVALQRANVTTLRTDCLQLSSVQNHHPGSFGDQQHLWQATLPGNVTVFSTHPGSQILDEHHRNATPSAWVGNGLNPMIGQDNNIVLVHYDLRGRSGFMERRRAGYTHLHFPFLQFTRTRLGPNWVAGQAGGAYIGIRTLSPLEMVGRDELRQWGKQTGYAVVVADRLDVANFEAFVQVMKESTLSLRGGALKFDSGFGQHVLRWKRGLWRDGVRLPHQFDRYDTPWVKADRRPESIDIACDGERLTLNFAEGLRTLHPSAH